jgi:hypothetical protein
MTLSSGFLAWSSLAKPQWFDATVSALGFGPANFDGFQTSTARASAFGSVGESLTHRETGHQPPAGVDEHASDRERVTALLKEFKEAAEHGP